MRAALHQHALVLRAGTGGRATSPAKLHLTLVFLGNVARTRIPQLAAIARDCTGGAFDLVLDRTDCWPRQHIVWMAPQSVPAALSRLVSALEQALHLQDFRIEDRAWRPHITLLRDARTPVADLPIALDWAVREFVLVESLRGEYRILDSWQLPAT